MNHANAWHLLASLAIIASACSSQPDPPPQPSCPPGTTTVPVTNGGVCVTQPFADFITCLKLSLESSELRSATQKTVDRVGVKVLDIQLGTTIASETAATILETSRPSPDGCRQINACLTNAHASTQPCLPDEKDAVTATLASQLQSLVSIESGQAPIPWLLRLYVKEPRDDWSQLEGDLAICKKLIGDTLASLKSRNQGAFLIHDFKNYRALVLELQRRLDIYDELNKMTTTKSARSADRIRALADEYDGLHAKLPDYEEALQRMLSAK